MNTPLKELFSDYRKGRQVPTPGKNCAMQLLDELSENLSYLSPDEEEDKKEKMIEELKESFDIENHLAEVLYDYWKSTRNSPKPVLTEE